MVDGAAKPIIPSMRKVVTDLRFQASTEIWQPAVQPFVDERRLPEPPTVLRDRAGGLNRLVGSHLCHNQVCIYAVPGKRQAPGWLTRRVTRGEGWF